jgi:CBS domain-containing protein
MTLKACDVMQRNVVTVTPKTNLSELADLLVGKRVGGLPVVESGAVVGVVSRSDFARVLSLDRSLAGLAAEAGERREFAPGEVAESVATTPRLEGRTVRDIMVTDPVSVSPQTPIDQVADAMVRRHLHRVFVVDGNTLCGVISALDIVALVASGRLRA